jgi:hypothetical protein
MEGILQQGPHYVAQVLALEGLVLDMVPMEKTTLSHEGELLGGI